MDEIQFLMYDADKKVVCAISAHTTQHGAAKKKAIGEYKEFNKHQKIVSDFDKEIKKVQGEHK